MARDAASLIDASASECGSPPRSAQRLVPSAMAEPHVQLGVDLAVGAALRLRHAALDERVPREADGGEEPEGRPRPDRGDERREHEADDEAGEPVHGGPASPAAPTGPPPGVLP